ncbi:MAG: bifunctional metallophosphatase/5'-nucleotidase [Alistipes sp.]|nr:bifunctional metallophosphatase/5'-nucleotidase [Alistipes sp.]
MKFTIRTLLLVILTLLAVRCVQRERTLVILSTNDMHGKIQRFPELATAVAACRDTTDRVLLVDAGDRWTGNAYVDRVAERGRPIVDLMKVVGYDAVALGNHEFDFGQAHLGAMLDSVFGFDVVCANVVSDTCTFRDPADYVILERGGVKVGLVGVITTYEGNNTPAGQASSYVGLSFLDPQQEAVRCAEELRDKVDVLVLLSHMGDDRDMELLARESRYDVLIGGHTHEYRDTVVCGTQLTQAYKDLRNVGVTKIRLRGKRVQSVDYENIPITNFAPDSAMRAAVQRYYADEELNRPIGTFAQTATQIGLANWFVDAMLRHTKAEVGFYHYGGVRLDSIAAGGVGTATIYDLEPFSSHAATMCMTPAQMRQMLMAKFNEPTREGGRYDLISKTPYQILTDAAGRAVDVRFPTLKEGRIYRVAISDYAFKNYRGLEYSEGRVEEALLTDLLFEELRRGAVNPDNTAYGTIRSVK